ncbi:MAG: FMN-binding protein [Burkholderiales bacterium]
MNFHRRYLATFLFALTGLCGAGASLGQTYLEPREFIADVLGSVPAPKTLWLNREMQSEVAAILGHPPRQLRQRYWSVNAKNVWILDETGKEDLITAGFVIVNGRIDHVRVLVYRESRGQEIRYPSFLGQFKDSKLAAGDRLDRDIDGISGATLSVAAMERMARLALYLDGKSRSQ